MVPLGNVIAQQRLTVAAANEDATGVGHQLVAGNSEEARTDIVHSRPQSVGTQA